MAVADGIAQNDALSSKSCHLASQVSNKREPGQHAVLDEIHDSVDSSKSPKVLSSQKHWIEWYAYSMGWEVGRKKSMATALGVPRRSPIQVLAELNAA